MTAALKVAEFATASLIALGALSLATPTYAKDVPMQEYKRESRMIGPFGLFGRTFIAPAQDAKAGCKIAAGGNTAQ